MKTKLLVVLVASMAVLAGCNKKEDTSTAVRTVYPNGQIGPIGGSCGNGSMTRFTPASKQALAAMMEGQIGYLDDVNLSNGVDFGGTIFYVKNAQGGNQGQALQSGVGGPSSIGFVIRDAQFYKNGQDKKYQIEFYLPLESGYALNGQTYLRFTDGHWLTIEIQGNFTYDVLNAQVKFRNHLTDSSGLLGTLNINPCSLFYGQ